MLLSGIAISGSAMAAFAGRGNRVQPARIAALDFGCSRPGQEKIDPVEWATRWLFVAQTHRSRPGTKGIQAPQTGYNAP